MEALAKHSPSVIFYHYAAHAIRLIPVPLCYLKASKSTENPMDYDPTFFRTYERANFELNGPLPLFVPSSSSCLFYSRAENTLRETIMGLRWCPDRMSLCEKLVIIPTL